jgi:hypothetical protein
LHSAFTVSKNFKLATANRKYERAFRD